MIAGDLVQVSRMIPALSLDQVVMVGPLERVVCVKGQKAGLLWPVYVNSNWTAPVRGGQHHLVKQGECTLWPGLGDWRWMR